MKPRPYQEIKSRFPGQEKWRWCWFDSEDVYDLDNWLYAGGDVPVAFDTETTGLDVFEDGIVACSFARDGEAWTLCFDETEGPAEWLLHWLASDRPKVLANAKFDYKIVAQYWGTKIGGIVADTMIMSQILDDTRRFHNLDSLAFDHLGLTKIPTAQIIGDGKDFVGWGPVPRDALATYANEDVVATHAVWRHLRQRCNDEGLADLLAMEMKVLPILADMEMVGVLLDGEILAQLTDDFAARERIAEEGARALAAEGRAALAAQKRQRFTVLDAAYAKHPRGKAPAALKSARLQARTAMRSAEAPLNLASPTQLQELLYGHWALHRQLGLRHPPMTKKKNPSTDNETLEKLEPYSPFVTHLLHYRQVSKLLSTYTRKMPEMVHPRTGRLHGNFWQCGARTGRMTSSDPNLQNIPNRTEEGRLLRTAFIPPPGYCIVAADYSQIEPRVAAHLSGEKVWIDAYVNGEDLYKATARAIWGDISEADMPAKRQLAKTVVLAALYGAGAGKIAATARITVEEAQALLDAFWAAVPCLRAFMDACVEEARKTGCVWTMDGLRRRHLEDINHRYGGLKRAAENQAGNTPVQGTAADILKLAIINVAQAEPLFGARLLLPVHDELVFECPLDTADAFCEWLPDRMTEVVQLSVPLKVEVARGQNWAEAH